MKNDLIKTAYNALDDKFGKDITVLNISDISILADYFIIATGNNSSQIQAMADEVMRKLFENGMPMRHIEGYDTANWILIDFGDIIIHIFDKDSRTFYNLERIWGDAKHENIRKEAK